MIKTTQAELIHMPASSALRYLPEGLITWGNTLVNVFIQLGASSTVGALHFFTADGETISLIELDGRPGAVYPTSQTRPDGSGIWFVPVDREARLYDVDLGAESAVVAQRATFADLRPDETANDSFVAGHWALLGTKNLPAWQRRDGGEAGLYAWKPGGPVFRILDGLDISNGMYLRESADGRFLGHIDSPAGQILEFPYKDGSPSGPPALGSGRVVVDISEQKSRSLPDGMVI